MYRNRREDIRAQVQTNVSMYQIEGRENIDVLQAAIRDMMPHVQALITAARMKESMTRCFSAHMDNFETFLKTIGMPAVVVTEHIAQWMAWQAEQGSHPNMIRQRRMSLARYYRFLIRHGHWTALNPVDIEALPKIVKRKPERFPFSEAQYKRILEFAAKDKEAWWHNACVVAWSTGLRLSDVAQLTRDSVNIEQRSLHLVPHKTRGIKPDPIDIPIDNDAWPAISQQLNDRTWGLSPYVFPEMNLYYVGSSREYLSNHFARMCDKAGLPDHSFHSFRHSFITRMLEGGMDTLMICAITGLDPKQVGTYAHIGLDAKRKAMHSARLVLAQAGTFEPEPLKILDAS